MADVTRLRQPFRKRLRAWFTFSREDRLGWLVTAMFIVAMITDARGHTDKATFIMTNAIVLLLLLK